MAKGIEKLVSILENKIFESQCVIKELKLSLEFLQDPKKRELVNSFIDQLENPANEMIGATNLASDQLQKIAQSVLLVVSEEELKKNIYTTKNTFKTIEETSQKILEALESDLIVQKLFEQLYYFLVSSDEELKNNLTYVDSLIFITPIFNMSDFKAAEIYEIMVEYARRSQLINFMDKVNFILDPSALYKHSFKTVTKEQKEYYFSMGIINLLSDETELDETGKAFAAEIKDSVDEFSIDIENVNAFKKVIKFFLYKKDSFEDSDIDEVLEALSNIQFSGKNLSAIRRFLERDLEKRRKKEKQQSNTEMKINNQEIVSTKKRYISDSEYKKLKKEVLKFYDLYTGELRKQLTYEETIKIASIMIRLDYDKSEVYAFLMRAFKKEEAMPNTIDSFINNYNKYIYYLGKESTLDILEYLKEMMISIDEDYIYWKRGVEGAIEELNHQLPEKVDYEYELAKKM